MTILVCPLSQVSEAVADHAPGRVVSLLDPGSEFPDLGPQYAGRHLQLELHDITEPAEFHIMPAPQHVHQLLGFVEQWDRRAPILFHCRAGISRSPAAAFIAA